MEPVEPDPEAAAFGRVAAEVAAGFAGEGPTTVRRFATGVTHYVYEARFSARAPVVVRLSRPADRAICRAAGTLNRRLRAIGVPLPQLLEDGGEAPVPFLILERLEGADLGEMIGGLSTPQLVALARRIATAQAAVAATPISGRYGYAAQADAAPLERWSQVLQANGERSRRRIAAAGLFSDEPVMRLEAAIERNRAALDAIAPTAFLHDTTTRNVIVGGKGTLSGIVDVDDLCFGDPRYVIALTEASLRVRDGPPAYTRAWLEAAGYEEDRLFRLYLALFLVDFMGEHGQVLNGNQPPSTAPDRARLLTLFEAAIRAV